MEGRKCVVLGKRLLYVSTGEEKLWIPSNLESDMTGRPPEDLGYRKREKSTGPPRQVIHKPIPLHRTAPRLPETLCPCIANNYFIGYRVLLT